MFLHTICDETVPRSVDIKILLLYTLWNTVLSYWNGDVNTLIFGENVFHSSVSTIAIVLISESKAHAVFQQNRIFHIMKPSSALKTISSNTFYQADVVRDITNPNLATNKRKRSPIVTFLCVLELINHLSCKDLTTYFSLAIGSFARAYSGRRTEIVYSNNRTVATYVIDIIA